MAEWQVLLLAVHQTTWMQRQGLRGPGSEGGGESGPVKPGGSQDV